MLNKNKNMEIIDKKSIKAKSMALKSVMNNDKLSRIVFDALDADPGSTKKNKAKSILRSIHKTTSNYYGVNDGMGGPASPFLTEEQQASPFFQPDLPEQGMSMDPEHLRQQEQKRREGQEIGGFKFEVPGEAGVEGDTKRAQTTPELVEPDRKTTFVSSVDDMISDVDKLKESAPDVPTIPGDPVVGTSDEVTYQQPKTADDLQYGAEVTYDDLSSIMQYSGASGLDYWFESLDPTEQTYYQDVYDAVKGGIGPEWFSTMGMANKEMLSSLGLPKDVLDALPQSGLLSTHLTDLRNSIKGAHKIDQQLDNLMNLQQRGMTIKDDLSAYIAGKDQYLGDIDKLIFDGSEKIAAMDTSNPYIANRMNNYMNYLTILHGRQNKRYIDFLNSGINYHNAELQQAKDLYDTTVSQAQDEYNSAATLTSEVYTNIKSMLKDLYKNVESRTTMLSDMQNNQLEVLKTSEEIIKMQLENDELRKKISGGNFDKVNIKTIDEIILGVEETDGEYTFNTNDPFEIYNSAVENKQNPDNIMRRYVSFVGKDTKAKVSTGDFEDSLLNHMGGLLAIENVINNLPSDEEIANTDPGTQDYYRNLIEYIEDYNNSMESTLYSSIRSGIRDYNDDKIDDIRAAIKDLAGIGAFDVRINDPDERKKSFMDNYKDNFGDITEIIYEIYDVSPEDLKAAEHYDSDNDTFADVLSNEIAEYYVTF